MTAARRLTITLSALALLLGACASPGPTTAHYDFGPLPAAPLSASRIGTLIVADIAGPAALDTEHMQYRLLYADARQSHPYAYNQWTATPFQLLNQRVKARVAQAGVKVLSTTDAAASPTLLRMEVDDFTQNFDSASSSRGTLSLRASVFRNHHLVDQQTFTRSMPAPTADAAGGARALAAATDAVTTDVLAWLATLPQP
jgi:cholesterol transport system auxiliary component